MSSKRKTVSRAAFCSQVCSFKVGAGLPFPRRHGEAKMPAAPSAARRAPLAVARLSEVERTEQVVTSEVMDPLGSPVYEQCMPFFMQMCWHSKQVATIKITRSQEQGGCVGWRREQCGGARGGDGSWNTTPPILPFAARRQHVSPLSKMLEKASVHKPDLFKLRGFTARGDAPFSIDFLSILLFFYKT